MTERKSDHTIIDISEKEDLTEVKQTNFETASNNSKLQTSTKVHSEGTNLTKNTAPTKNNTDSHNDLITSIFTTEEKSDTEQLKHNERGGDTQKSIGPEVKEFNENENHLDNITYNNFENDNESFNGSNESQNLVVEDRFGNINGELINDEINSKLRQELAAIIPDVNVYQQKKNLAQGMMDLALFSANANQLRYVLEVATFHPYYYPSLICISVSLILQIAVGVGLILNSRYDVKHHEEIFKADRVNNFTVIGIFLITIVNVFISSFGVAQTPNTTNTLINPK